MHEMELRSKDRQTDIETNMEKRGENDVRIYEKRTLNEREKRDIADRHTLAVRKDLPILQKQFTSLQTKENYLRKLFFLSEKCLDITVVTSAYLCKANHIYMQFLEMLPTAHSPKFTSRLLV